MRAMYTSKSVGEEPMTVEAIADGFIRVANETMCEPICESKEAKRRDVRDHSLAHYGGPGGQLVCAIAASLGIRTVFVPK